MRKRHLKVVTLLAIVMVMPAMSLLPQPVGMAAHPVPGTPAAAHARTQVPPTNVSFITAIQAGFR